MRIEPEGPQGFEDRTTFMVVNRNFTGIPMTQSGNDTHAIFTTAYYTVVVTQPASPPPSPIPPSMCTALSNTDVDSGDRIPTCQNMANPCLSGVTQNECCGNCTVGNECTAWIYSPSGQNCWLMADVSGTHPATDRNCGKTPTNLVL